MTPVPPLPSSSPVSSSASSSHLSNASFPNADVKPKRHRRRHTSGDPIRVGGAGGRRSSVYRGVTRHRWTGRYEAHLWDKDFWNKSLNKKGKQVYLGAYDDEEAAARTYDLAALKYWGPSTILNFPASTYAKEYADMHGMSKEDYLTTLRRRSSGFARGASKYRGVARPPEISRFQAARANGRRHICRLRRSAAGTTIMGDGKQGSAAFMATSTQEEAAQAYDRAALIYRGSRAVTNFDVSRYTSNPPPLPPPPPPLLRPHALSLPPQPSQPEQNIPSPATGEIAELSWTMCMDWSFESYPISHLDSDKLLDFSDILDIEHLFEGSETTDGKGNAGAEDSVKIRDAGDRAPGESSSFAASVAGGFPISICS